MIGNFADIRLEQTASYMLPHWGASRLRGVLLRDTATLEPLAAALVVLATLPLVRLGFAHVGFGPLWRSRAQPLAPALLPTAL